MIIDNRLLAVKGLEVGLDSIKNFLKELRSCSWHEEAYQSSLQPNLFFHQVIYLCESSLPALLLFASQTFERINCAFRNSFSSGIV
jgi:hypothetical protein